MGQMMAGDPSKPAECEEQEEARKYLKQIIREDPELRQRLKFWKQYVDAPNGRERLYKEIVLPKMIEQMRFGRAAQSDYDYYNHPFGLYYNWMDRGWMYVLAGGILWSWSRGWYVRHFG